MIYLDNAATTDYKPQCVIDAVTEAITKYPFNPNRGGHKQALELERKLYQTRKKLSLLCHNDSEKHVAFTGGCTEALNLAILGNARRGHVIVSCYEHNSVLRPLMQLHKRGFITVSVAQADENGDVRAEEIERLIQKDTYMLCVSHASNVNGKSQRLYELGELARQKNLLFLVDCAQSVGYFPIDMSKCNVDMAALAGHKGLHGIQGAGALVFHMGAAGHSSEGGMTTMAGGSAGSAGVSGSAGELAGGSAGTSAGPAAGVLGSGAGEALGGAGVSSAGVPGTTGAETCSSLGGPTSTRRSRCL